MRNQAVAQLLDNIARLLAIKGESAFRVRAYAQAARSLAGLTEDVADLWREGRLETIPGVGASIAARIDDYLRTGRSSYYEDLKREIAPEAVELLDVPSIGPVRAHDIYARLGIATLGELEEAARRHRLRQLPGIGERSEERILREIARLRQRTRRLLLGTALPAAEEVLARLRQHPAVARADLAGSLRRMRETIGDIDLLIASDRPADAVAAFTGLPLVKEVLLAGLTRASVLTDSDLQIDARVVLPGEYGSALQYFTGSKAHNVALRGLASEKGFKLSEYGLFDSRSGRRVAGETEDEVYWTLGLRAMPPELRESRGELAAAAEDRLPRLVELGDARGDLHVHSDWSDGADSLAAMARAAAERGYEYVAITDHSRRLRVAHGLSIEQVREQGRVVDALNRELAPFRVLHGVELDILPDGALDYPDEVLAQLDYVGVSVHSRFDQTVQQMTDRITRAIRNPFVCALNHPTGRLIDRRAGYPVDLERVIEVAVAEGVALEIDGQPDRLDLDDVWARRAAEAGATLVCDSDAHSTAQLAAMRYAVAVARRGWLEAKDVLNTRPLAGVLEFRDRRRRRPAA